MIPVVQLLEFEGYSDEDVGVERSVVLLGKGKRTLPPVRNHLTLAELYIEEMLDDILQ